jgi:hypothetical protein
MEFGDTIGPHIASLKPGERTRMSINKGTRVQGDSKYSFPKPSTLRQMSATELAWLAGWLEGEGSFSIKHIKGWNYASIVGGSTDFDSIQRLVELTNVGRVIER